MESAHRRTRHVFTQRSYEDPGTCGRYYSPISDNFILHHSWIHSSCAWLYILQYLKAQRRMRGLSRVKQCQWTISTETWNSYKQRLQTTSYNLHSLIERIDIILPTNTTKSVRALSKIELRGKDFQISRVFLGWDTRAIQLKEDSLAKVQIKNTQSLE